MKLLPHQFSLSYATEELGTLPSTIWSIPWRQVVEGPPQVAHSRLIIDVLFIDPLAWTFNIARAGRPVPAVLHHGAKATETGESDFVNLRLKPLIFRKIHIS